MGKPIAGNNPKLNEWLEGLGIDLSQNVHRVMIDIRVNDVVQIYVQRHADDRLFHAGLPDEVLSAPVVELSTEEPHDG